MDPSTWQQWVGREQTVHGVVAAETARLMQATLSRPPTLTDGDPLPPGWHWLTCHEPVATADLGDDGHPRLGGFLPPIAFAGRAPRRMWAGGSLTFLHPLHIGDHAVRHSTVRAVTPKSGRSGDLVFVIVRHELRVADVTCLVEDQTLVYREPTGGTAAAAPRAPEESVVSAEYHPTPALLWRYSALTFNAHRIHYDADYCRDHEGYPGLVVHGPLIATLLLDLFRRQWPDRPLRRFDYRGVSPLFVGAPFTVHAAATGHGWAADAAGRLAMSADVTF